MVKQRGHDVYTVKTIEFNKTLKETCESRNDEWATEALGRLNTAPSDLHAADAIYHHQCNINFSTKTKITENR